MSIRGLVLSAALLALAAPAHGSSYELSARAQTIAAALATLQSNPAGALALRDAIRDEARSRCRGSDNALVVRCFIEVAREQCSAGGTDAPGCRALADVIVTNHRGSGSFVDDATRFALMNKADNFRAALDAELDRQYALLATDLALSNRRVDAAAIDTFCVKRARATELPWQRCVAALVWFIGSQKEPS